MKVALHRNPMGGLEIYLFRVGFGNKMYMAKTVELVFEEIESQAVQLEPTLKIPFTDGDEFCKSMSEALVGAGVKSDNDHKIEGILEATRTHLADMQKLVFER